MMQLWYSASPAVNWLSVLLCFLFYIDTAHVKNIVLQSTERYGKIVLCSVVTCKLHKQV